MPTDRPRCAWANSTPEYVAYHDEEWGTPLHGDDALFERLCLEAFQSGLSWITILRKRPAFRAAFAGFAIDAVAAFDRRRRGPAHGRRRHRPQPREDRRRRSATPVRRRSSRTACRRCCGPSRRPVRATRPATLADVPATSPESVAMAKELKRRGFVFVGPTTAYALMQATGMVDDHVADCFRARPGSATRKGADVGRMPLIRDHWSGAHSIDGRRITFCPGRSGAAGEGGTHGGHEAAHG